MPLPFRLHFLQVSADGQPGSGCLDLAFLSAVLRTSQGPTSPGASAYTGPLGTKDAAAAFGAPVRCDRRFGPQPELPCNLELAGEEG